MRCYQVCGAQTTRTNNQRRAKISLNFDDLMSITILPLLSQRVSVCD